MINCVNALRSSTMRSRRSNHEHSEMEAAIDSEKGGGGEVVWERLFRAVYREGNEKLMTLSLNYSSRWFPAKGSREASGIWQSRWIKGRFCFCLRWERSSREKMDDAEGRGVWCWSNVLDVFWCPRGETGFNQEHGQFTEQPEGSVWVQMLVGG